MNYERAIVICGKIRSGKSYLASQLQQTFNLPIASFGEYLVQYAENLGLSTDRSCLQDLGEDLIKYDPAKFLTNVMLFSSSSHEQMIFEGVRHQSVLKTIKERFSKCVIIYLDIPESVRLERYLQARKNIDSFASAAEFYSRSMHSVESDIDNLIPLSNYVFLDNNDISNYWQSLHNFLKS